MWALLGVAFTGVGRGLSGEQGSNKDGGADPSFLRTAQMTGGQAFPSSPEEMGALGEILGLLSTANDGDVLSVHDRLAEKPLTWSFPLDDSFARVVFSVVGTREVTVTRPDGTLLAAEQAGVKVVELRKGAKVFAVERPAAGTWSVAASGKGRVSLRVLGKSPVFLSDFCFVKEGGRPGHEGLFPRQGAPIRGSDSQAQGRLSEGFVEARFELRALDGKVLARPELVAEGGMESFLGRVKVPAQPFLVYVVGRGARGGAIQRCKPFVELPATVELSAPRRLAIAFGKPGGLAITVGNRGAPGLFRTTACDGNAALLSAKPETLELGQGESKEVQLSWKALAAGPAGVASQLMVTVERLKDRDDQSSLVIDLEAE